MPTSSSLHLDPTKHPYEVKIQKDGCTAIYTGQANHAYDFGCVRGKTSFSRPKVLPAGCFPKAQLLVYFEVTILKAMVMVRRYYSRVGIVDVLPPSTCHPGCCPSPAHKSLEDLADAHKHDLPLTTLHR